MGGTINEEQFKQIQSLCREWLSDPTTNRESRLTIPAGGGVSESITIEFKTILTFDNVLITSAVGVESGTCFTKLIGKSGEPGTFIDAPFDMIAASDERRAGVMPQKCGEMESVPGAAATGSVQPRKLGTGGQDSSVDPVPTAPGSDSTATTKPHDDRSMAFETNSTDEKYLLYSNGTVLGFSSLEKTKSQHQRTGRFFPSDDYFEFAEIFEEFPQAENDCLDANVHEAYGLTYDNADVFRKKFNDLCERIDALKLYVVDDQGKQIAVTEVKLEDLSKFYSDESERWLHVDFERPLQNREP